MVDVNQDYQEGEMKLYSTSDEIRYLNRIGKHSEIRRYTQDRRRMLLKNYLCHSYLRDDWGAIDAGEVRRHVVGMLNGGGK